MNALAVFGAAIRMESNSERSQHLIRMESNSVYTQYESNTCCKVVKKAFQGYIEYIPITQWHINGIGLSHSGILVMVSAYFTCSNIGIGSIGGTLPACYTIVKLLMPFLPQCCLYRQCCAAVTP